MLIKIIMKRPSHTYASENKGAVLALGCFLVIALLAGAALAADGFMLLQTYIKLHNGAEYAAEAALRVFTADKSLSTACNRADQVANYHLLETSASPNINCNSSDFDLGIYNKANKTFQKSEPDDTDYDPDSINAVRLRVATNSPKFFFARVIGQETTTVRAEVVVYREDTPDGLYQYRLVEPSASSSSSTSSSSSSSGSSTSYSSSPSSASSASSYTPSSSSIMSWSWPSSVL